MQSSPLMVHHPRPAVQGQFPFSQRPLWWFDYPMVRFESIYKGGSLKTGPLEGAFRLDEGPIWLMVVEYPRQGTQTGAFRTINSGRP